MTFPPTIDPIETFTKASVAEYVSRLEKQAKLAEEYIAHLHDRCGRYERYINSSNPGCLTVEDWQRLDHESQEFKAAWKG